MDLAVCLNDLSGIFKDVAMLSENFIYFFTVQGFFVGVIFGILKSLDAIGLLDLYTFITAFFYLFGTTKRFLL